MDSFQITVNPTTFRVESIRLYGRELLNEESQEQYDLWINGEPLETRPYPTDDREQGEVGNECRLKGEHTINQLSGAGLVINRKVGGRDNLTFNCFGVNYHIRRERADMTDLEEPGPGGPVIEAPLHVDTFGLLNWDWLFWGDQTRMIYPSSHSQGPCHEYGHIGYEHDTPERCKEFMRNRWRRTYPGCMVVHGRLFYNEQTEHWIAPTCRRPHLGYCLNVDDAGSGVGYDFLLHAPFELGDALRMPEIKIYYGDDYEEMMEWLGWYTTFYYQEPPDWFHRKLWCSGLAWDNEPTWTEQVDKWESELDHGLYNAIGYSLVTNRPLQSGTLPVGYEPDPNHGTIEEFKDMCHRLRARDVPLLIWMSHSGLAPGAQEVDDDWFIRGIDGRMSAGWGSEDGGMMMVNPGHPGYIEYTKKWIHFYLVECGCKGIFFDCLSWVFPPDFKPRDFMRYPSDTNLMGIKFQREIYHYIKECDEEAVMLGEGASLDGPIDIFSIGGNPVRAIDGMGPRDFFLQLNRYAPKRMTIDQGGCNFPASGMCKTSLEKFSPAHNRFMVNLLEEEGAGEAFTHLPGDLSIFEDMLFVPFKASSPPNTDYYPPRDTIKLPDPWDGVEQLEGKFHDHLIHRNSDGAFEGLQPGIYEMK